jgi:hypothetical protein
MANESKTTRLKRESSGRFKLGQFLFLVALAVGVYLLGRSMVEHRFFRGGHQEKHGSLMP